MIIQNYSSGFLASAITSGTTSVIVNPGSTLPTTYGLFTATIWNNTTYTDPSQDPNAEIVWCQYSATNTYTITRGMEGTAATAHPAGSLVGLYITAGVLSLPYIKISETESSGTNGGTATSGSWQNRILNTVDNDTSSISTLSSNQIVLPAGTYKVNVVSPFIDVAKCQIRLQNITSGGTLIIGNSLQSGGSVGVTIFGILSGQFTLNITSSLAIQYQCQGSGSNTDLGQACGFDKEVYTVAEFTLVNT